MNQPDPAEIEAIAARAEAATPGPWTLMGAEGDDHATLWSDEKNALGSYVVGHAAFSADATFIAHARQDIPTLLAALATERERAEKAEAKLAVAEVVIEAAKPVDEAIECANFFGDGQPRFNCYVEPPEGWAITLAPCLFCALANYHKATGPSDD